MHIREEARQRRRGGGIGVAADFLRLVLDMTERRELSDVTPCINSQPIIRPSGNSTVRLAAKGVCLDSRLCEGRIHPDRAVVPQHLTRGDARDRGVAEAVQRMRVAGGGRIGDAVT